MDIFSSVGVIGILVIAIWIASINHYKVHYEKTEPISYEEACEEHPYGEAAGYPPGKDIPVAKSIEDIMEYEYCTIEVSKEDITSTRFFRIKDVSEAGDSYSKVGSKHIGRHVKELYGMSFNWLGDIAYKVRQARWNLSETSYGEWCSVKLENGEQIYIFVDLKLLDISSDGEIKLPIGTLKKRDQLQILVDQCEQFGVLEENAYWYVDMVGDWEDTEVGDFDPAMRAIAFLGIAAVAVAGLEIYIRKHW